MSDESDEFVRCVRKCEEECKNLYEPDELGLFNVGCIVECMEECKSEYSKKQGETEGGG